MKENSILIIRMSALGDVAMTIPAIYSLAHQYPSWTVKVLTQPLFSRLFINKPQNIKILAVDKKHLKTLMSLYKLLKRLGNENITVVADYHNVLRSWLIDLFFLLRGKKVSMLQKNRLSRWKILKNKEEARLFTERYYDVLYRLGFSVVPSFKSLFKESTKTEEQDSVKIGIAPFGRYKNKIYPIEQMRIIVENIVENGYVAYLFGSKGKEQDVLEKWKAVINKPNIIVVAGRYSIEKELELMAQLNVMISMDSANMHLASLTGTKVVSIWGSTTPACGFLGYGQDKANAICLGLRCQPCTIAGSNTCKFGTFDCMVNIPPMMIINRINELIKN